MAPAVDVNVNYRYSLGELTYLFDNADVEAVICDAEFANLAVGLRARLPKLRFIIQIAARSDEAANCVDYEGWIAQSERLPRASYREDDIFMLYTGGSPEIGRAHV